MLSLFLGLLCLTQEEKPQDPEPAPQTVAPAEHHCPCIPEYSVELRAGGWWMGAFDAQTPLGRRQIDSTLFFDAGIDLKFQRLGWTLTLSGDYAAANDVRVLAGAARVGKSFSLSGGGAPLDLQLSAGPLFGSLEVDMTGFGDFKSSVGFEGRADLIAQVHERIGLDFWLAYRQISFKYDEPMTSGDTHAGGATLAVGLGILMRF